MTGILKCDTIQNSAGAFEHARLVQVVNTEFTTSDTGTTVIPYDTSIPQITEGDEYFTLAITPTHASNKLVIEVLLNFTHGTSGNLVTIALFQDTTANALKAVAERADNNSYSQVCMLRHYMTTGTTSSTTFRVRVGGESGTTHINKDATSQKLGGTMASSMTISEIRE
tara:strand:- start:152 stop:658 length:507 start_codon:yes stop_codon:yes gene_type:complete